MERKKNWEWSIEQNERWQAKMDESKAKADSSFHSESESAYFQISLPFPLLESSMLVLV
jgi:hypothetical protein